MPQQDQRLTREQVINIVGRIDDMKIAMIIATGATSAELMEARTWLHSDDYLGVALKRSPAGRVGRLVETLKSDEGDWDDR